MNLLPFVFTMLLLLTLMGSFLFSSLVRTTREKTVILSQHQAYLKLLSEQNKESFEEKKPQGPKPDTDPGGKNGEKNSSKTSEPKPYPRELREGFPGSKFNLSPLFKTNNPQLKQALEKTFLRLIEILYGSQEFYQTACQKKLPEILVKELVLAEPPTFEQFHSKNTEIGDFYYKMLKGTNTGYPPLTEYCTLTKESTKPFHFKYATTPVLRAALGNELAEKVIQLEKTCGKEGKSWALLNKKDFLDLVKKNPSASISELLLEELFEYRKVKKGMAQIYQSKAGKIRALHEVEF